MLWNSGRSLPLPAYSVVATLNCVTCLPLASARISGSRVRRPVRRTLFTVHDSLSIGRRVTGRSCVRRGLSFGDGATVARAAHRSITAGSSADLRSARSCKESATGYVRPGVGARMRRTFDPARGGTYRPLPEPRSPAYGSVAERGTPGALGASATDHRTDAGAGEGTAS